MFSEETPFDEGDVADIGERGGASQHGRRFQSQLGALGVVEGHHIGAIQNLVAGGTLQVLVVLGPDAFVVALRRQNFFAIAIAEAGDLGDQVSLRTEGAFRGDLGLHPESGDGGTHDDDAGDANDDAEQRQKAAQAMGFDRIPGESEGGVEPEPSGGIASDGEGNGR